MDREIASEGEILQWMNAELHNDQENEDCQFDSIIMLKVKDECGCNWSESNIRCSGVSMATCEGRAMEIITQAKAKFNVN